MVRRTDVLAHLLESALTERVASPVVELLGAIPVPLAVVHAGDQRIVVLNDAMRDLFRRPAEDIVGHRLNELLPASHPLTDPTPLVEAVDRDAAARRPPHLPQDQATEPADRGHDAGRPIRLRDRSCGLTSKPGVGSEFKIELPKAAGSS